MRYLFQWDEYKVRCNARARFSYKTSAGAFDRRLGHLISLRFDYNTAPRWMICSHPDSARQQFRVFAVPISIYGSIQRTYGSAFYRFELTALLKSSLKG